jgi:putative Holliday junction resolvase
MATSIIALDIGEKRIGIARANKIAKIPEPIAVISNDSAFDAILNRILIEQDADTIIVGLPRNLSGEETKQSIYTRNFAAEHLGKYNIIWQDETLSSVSAESRKSNSKLGLDAHAACVILEDYLEQN